MPRKILFVFVVILISVNCYAQSQQEYLKKLYTQGVISLVKAKKKCVVLSQKNRELVKSMANVHKIAKEKGNPSVGVFAETDYLLGFLQERVDDVCGRLDLANEQTVNIIVSSESEILVEKMALSKDFSDYVDRIFGTEYSKFLYLTATPESLEKMHGKWANNMAAQRKDIYSMIRNIKKGNKVLREELTDFTKAFKYYYEDVAGMFDGKKKKEKKSPKSK